MQATATLGKPPLLGGHSPSQPLFAEIVQPATSREAQWRQIVACRANHRLCHLFKSPADYLEFSACFGSRWECN